MKGKDSLHKERAHDQQGSALDGVPLAMPAMLRAFKLQKKAARVGFDWPDIQGVFDKVQEELAELHEEVGPEPDQAALLDECGDLLFAAVNLVRFAGMDPEIALQQTNDKFISRFQRVEAQCAATGSCVADMDLETLEKFWERAKQEEGG